MRKKSQNDGDVVNEVDKLVEKGLMVKVERGVYGLTRLVTSQQGKGEA
jgi:hypothetical protein